MSILDKPLTTEKRQKKRWPFFLLTPLVLLILVLLFIGPGTDVAFVQHFFSAPQHVTYSGHSSYISSLAWSPDGKRIASASGDHTVQIWNASNGSHVLTYRGDTLDVSALAWSPNGAMLVSGDVAGLVQVWNAATGQLIFTYRKHSGAIYSLAWSPDDQSIASASGDGSLQVWQATTGTPVFTIQNPLPARGALLPQPWNAVAWSPNGQYIAAGGTGNAQVFFAHSGRLVSSAYGYNGDTIHAIAWSPDGQYIATAQASGSVLIWNVADARIAFGYNGGSNDINSVSWSPDGKRIASGGNDGFVQVWEALSGQQIYTYRGHADIYPGHFTSNAPVYAVAWSPDGRHIASGGNDNTIQVWPAPAN